jgi:tetratricopeptide (TPR) repeat protein
LRRFAVIVGACGLVVAAVIGGYALRSKDEPARHPPLAAVDPKTLTTDRGVEWLLAAVERGQLDDASEKYDMAGALEQQSGAPVQASIAWSAGALVLALRGHLVEARAHLHDADANKGSDPVAVAYVDLATAALASAGGDQATALASGERCATEFASTVPVLGAMCLELDGGAAADKGDVAAARRAYEAALVITKREDNAARTMAVELALAELDLDEGKDELVVPAVAAVQATAAERGAVSLEARAWVLLARAHLAQAASQNALEDLGHVKPETVEPLQIRIAYQIALGQTHALLGDTEVGLGELAAARAEAEKQGFPGLVLAARLAALEVAVAVAAHDAATDQRALVSDARAGGYGRIAHLAETVTQR